MGLPLDPDSHPINDSPHSSSTSQQNADAIDPSNRNDPMQQQSQRPSNPSELSQAALDLASKLFDVARNGQTTILSQYLEAGLKPNLTNHEGNTLLMLAAYSGHVETTQLLLERGADVNALNQRGQSPLAGALFKGYDEVAEVLWKAGASAEAGQPNAKDCAAMFKRERWIKEFEGSG